MEDVIGKTFTSKGGKEVSVDKIKGKVIGVLFSASWSMTAKSFLPRLISFYDAINAEKKRMEIILVSNDTSEEEMKQHMNEMPWLGIPYGDSVRIAYLQKYCGIFGVPTLVLLNRNGDIITRGGRMDIYTEPDSCYLKWVDASE